MCKNEQTATILASHDALLGRDSKPFHADPHMLQAEADAARMELEMAHMASAAASANFQEQSADLRAKLEAAERQLRSASTSSCTVYLCRAEQVSCLDMPTSPLRPVTTVSAKMGS